jgi:uncharacterized protein (DUF3820 family)
MTDTDLMPFGKHKGKRMIDVPASYLLWLLDALKNDTRNVEVKQYLQENKEALKLEVKKNSKL